MNKHSLTILKYLNKYSSHENQLTTQQILDNNKIDEETLDEVLNYLSILKYIDNSYHYYEINNIMASEPTYFSTILGLNYFRKNRLEWLKSILNGIVFPIIVSIIVNFIALFI